MPQFLHKRLRFSSTKMFEMFFKPNDENCCEEYNVGQGLQDHLAALLIDGYRSCHFLSSGEFIIIQNGQPAGRS